MEYKLATACPALAGKSHKITQKDLPYGDMLATNYTNGTNKYN
jgi:hypothetical protein